MKKKYFSIVLITFLFFNSLNAQTSKDFLFTGSDQSFTIPNSITNIDIELWGAGGGEGGDAYSTAEGGSGAYVKGSLSVTPGDIINIIVGEGGVEGTTATYGGGTAGTYINNGQYGGAGGGRTAIQINGIDVVSAGGGGGAGAISYVMTNGGVGGTGAKSNIGGIGGSSTTAGEGGFSYLTDTLFTLDVSTNGGANNSGSGSGRNGKAKISWSTTLSIPTNLVSYNTNIYPNPTTDYIKFSGLINTEGYTIYNVLGTIISQGNIDNNQQINVKNFATGLYFVKLTNGNTLKFVKN